MGSPWKAIADDNRRQMLILLREEEKTPSEIAKHFDFTLPALSTHLRILKEANLVQDRKEGKNRLYSINKDTMTEMTQFFNTFWTQKLHDLKHHIEEDAKRHQK